MRATSGWQFTTSTGSGKLGASRRISRKISYATVTRDRMCPLPSQ